MSHVESRRGPARSRRAHARQGPFLLPGRGAPSLYRFFAVTPATFDVIFAMRATERPVLSPGGTTNGVAGNRAMAKVTGHPMVMRSCPSSGVTRRVVHEIQGYQARRWPGRWRNRSDDCRGC